MQRRFANMSNRKIDYKMADYFRSIVDKSGLSQEEWATRLGVTPRSVAYYCSGQRTPSAKRLLLFQKIAESLWKKQRPYGWTGPQGCCFLNRRFIVRSSFMCDNVYITYKGGHQNVKVKNGQSMEQGFREPWNRFRLCRSRNAEIRLWRSAQRLSSDTWPHPSAVARRQWCCRKYRHLPSWYQRRKSG